MYPLLPLAIAAREQGHDIVYAVDPGFQEPVRKLGFTVVDAGMGIWEAFKLANSSHGTPEFEREDLRQVAADAFGSILPRKFVEDLTPIVGQIKPDLVVFEIINPAAGIVAMQAGIPAVCHGFGKMDDTLVPDVIRNRLLEYVAELGISLPDGHHYGLGAPYIDVFPPSLQDLRYLSGVQRIPLRPIPFAEPGELPGWVTEHVKPLIYLTFGTAFANEDVLRTAIAGLSEVDAEVLVASGPLVEPSALTGAPGNVHVLPWVPQADLLAHADLVVHHGGAGTTVAAMANAVPQVVLPQGADQFRNAEVVANAGLGAQLVGEQFTKDALHEAVRTLLHNTEVRAAADGIAAEIAAMPHPDEVVPKLVELAG